MSDLGGKIQTSLGQSVAEAAKYLMAHKETLVALTRELDSQISGHSNEQFLGDLPNTKDRLPLYISPSYWLLIGFRKLSLNSPLGRSLVELAEALGRIDHKPTAMALLQDKCALLTHSPSLPFVLKVALQLVVKHRFMAAMALPVAQRLIDYFAGHFVFAQSIEQALINQSQLPEAMQAVSIDCLGEAAQSDREAGIFFKSYLQAIERIEQAIMRRGTDQSSRQPLAVSIKLSALHPCFEGLKVDQLSRELLPKVHQLALAAQRASIGLTLDAEESWQQALTLAVFSELARAPCLSHWSGLGIAVQAYQPNALSVLSYIEQLAQQRKSPLAVRLVKGAYWDTEIKHAQQLGLSDYPVYTRKSDTDKNYRRCVVFISARRDKLYGQFASHNPKSLSFVLNQYAEDWPNFEIQMLHGMGQDTARKLLCQYPSLTLRRYAPVGQKKDLLPYLLRRLLENGANTGIWSEAHYEQNEPVAKRQIPEPRDLYLSCSQWPRLNSQGVDYSQYRHYQVFNNVTPDNAYSNIELLNHARAENNFYAAWRRLDSIEEVVWRQRSEHAEALADLLQSHKDSLMRCLMSESGKTIVDAQAEVREAIDFCRYYSASQTRLLATQEAASAGVKGIALCISPWNFPLAILCGQAIAAYLSGYSVLLKPASHSGSIAGLFVELCHRAGITDKKLQLLNLTGKGVGELLAEIDLQAVLFTGSNQSAKAIQAGLFLAAQQYQRAPALFVAETGGINGLYIEGSAHLQQAIDIVIESAFYSAGQRCSALRLLVLQDDIAAEFCARLLGALGTLSVGQSSHIETDIGPMISLQARDQAIDQWGSLMSKAGVKVLLAPKAFEQGGKAYLTPGVIALESIDQLSVEIFAPILAIVTTPRRGFQQAVSQLAGKGFGLTMGLVSRNQTWLDAMAESALVGNIYINRSITGATVGVQPFGGMGLSGTGPKAGGPEYLDNLMQVKRLNSRVQRLELLSPVGEKNTWQMVRNPRRALCIKAAMLNTDFLNRIEHNLDEVSAIILDDSVSNDANECLRRLYDIVLKHPRIIPIISGRQSLQADYLEKTLSTNTAAIGGDIELLG